jgi:exodeoxyribonuclease-1
MAETSLYWHDYETFGVDPRRDAPAQFAGLRTDENLNLIGKPLVIYCRPPRDRLPSPEACLVTGITPQQALAKGVCEAEFIGAIHAELSRAKTCGVGYNSLRFDDEVTRNCLYRNFYDPYEREWRNGNSRWDIIDMVRLTAALRPEGIEWPLDQAGRPSFRLELLTQANGISHGGAHDALADVKATIDLARLVKKRQPRLYDFIWRNRGKHEAHGLLKLGSFEPVLHVSEKYPAERGCIALVVALARHPVNQNEVAVVDLSADPGPLLELSAEEIRTRLFTRALDLPEGVERIPLKTVHLNKCPILVPVKAMNPADAERLNIDPDRCQLHLAGLKSAVGLAAKLEEAFTRPHSESPGQDPDLMIYSGGFFSNADKNKLARLREMKPEQLALSKPAFDDPRLPEMLFRFRARNYPQTLTGEEQARWEAFRHRSLNEKVPGGGMVVGEYEEQMAKLEAQAEIKPRDREIIGQLREWGRGLIQGDPNG